MFTLRQLEFAVAVAEEGGFTAAAARCHTVQSALSHQIARLEEAFGTRLFERSHRRVRPTAAGEVFLHNARLTLQAAARLHEEMALTLGTVRGRINIGQITSLNVVDVPALLAAFRAAHPAVEVHLKVGMSDVLLAELEDGRLDVALVGVGPQISLPPQHRLLHEEGLSLVMPIDHPLTQHRTIPLQALQGLPLAALVPGAGVRRMLDDALHERGIQAQLQYEVTHSELQQQLVAAGLAVAVVPDSMAARMQRTVVRPLVEDFHFRTCAVWRADPTPAARALLGLLPANQA
ncbi:MULTISPECIES: LysR family transcriptional regulator [Stenotrophomonas]|uniref:LysR family transcriptional regulator n=1 Tax=Stenotrophomonas TaxID=40323 RepID=UPI000770059E|nr:MULTISPECIES: LysR family transcriptional regulator [Stenotrophomonas]AMJ57896.1 LysR family transcriptional regulator [Stenotrophomonas sp. KCTC 12332]